MKHLQTLRFLLCCILGLPITLAGQTPVEWTERGVTDAYRPFWMDTTEAPTVLAFGSCNMIDKPQNLWEDVVASNPDLWVWLGDIVYADTNDMRALSGMYRKLKSDPGYRRLRAKTQITGIYDDHDYGENDGGKSFSAKAGSRVCLLDFLDVPKSHPMRKREGGYIAYTFGQGARSVKVIVLDTRYFRDTLLPDPSKMRRYQPNLEGDMLGEQQWDWLEAELRNSRAGLHILCSSVQVIADDHGYEKWGNFPASRRRLLTLISEIRPKNLLIISGDRHMAEVSKLDMAGLPYPLYDFTSSGMTHIRSSNSEVNRFRVGDMIVKRNFGVLRISWEGDRPIVRMEVHGLNHEVYQELMVRY